jgi:hypothetical protein
VRRADAGFPDIQGIRDALERNSKERAKGGRVTAVYADGYRNPQSGLYDLVILRIDYPPSPEGAKRKRYAQAHQIGNGRYLLKAPEKPWPLYNRQAISRSQVVVVVEGEKCADALGALGFAATTSPGGAGKAVYADWRPLAGKEAVYVLPDYDPQDAAGRRTGYRHMIDVSRLLLELTPPPQQVLWVNPEHLGLTEGQDIADWCERTKGLSDDERQQILSDAFGSARRVTAMQDLAEHVEGIIAHRDYAIDWPWRYVSELTQALLPGSCTLLSGSPGVSKSLAVLQLLRFWTEEGEPASALMLEGDLLFHLRRALAQITQQRLLCVNSWVEEHPEESRQALDAHADELARLRQRVFTLPRDQEATPETILAWISARCAAGDKILVIDPLTYMDLGGQVWVADNRFMIQAMNMCQDAGARLVVITHPRKHSERKWSRVHLDDVAWSAAMTRRPDTVLWLHHMGQETEGTVRTPFGRTVGRYNRILVVLKARMAAGTGATIAMQFDVNSLTIQEIGQIR